MHPATLTRIEAFREQIFIPALQDIEALLQSPTHRFVIVSDAATGTPVIDVMLQQMHPGQRYLTQASSPPRPATDAPSAQTWIGDSIYVDILEGETEAVLCCTGQYCLSIEFRITPVDRLNDHIHLTSIIGCIQPDVKPLQLQHRPFGAESYPLEIEDIDATEILSHFLESWEAFEAQLPRPAVIPTAAPDPTPVEPEPALSATEVEPAQPLIPTEAPPAPIGIAPEPAPEPAPEEPAQLTQPPQPAEIAPEPAPNPEPVEPAAPPILTPQQQLYALQQKVVELSKQLSPTHTPLTCKLNPDLSEPCHIIALRDRHERLIDLCLEYSPTITESELLDQLQRLSYYQGLELLAHQRQFLEARLQAWLKRYDQPSDGAIVPYLQQHLTQHSQTLYRRLKVLTDTCLAPLSPSDLQAELTHFTTHQNHEKAILDQLDQVDGHPILGYLDARLIQQHTPSESQREDHPSLGYLALSSQEGDAPLVFINPFTASHPSLVPEITHFAQHLHRKDKSLQLTLIEACASEPYQAYQQRFVSETALYTAIRYTLTQKLYPNRTFSIGPSAKDAYPRLELLWGGTAETTPPDHPFTQIWRIYPMIRMHPPQWLVMTATSETQKLKTIVLENGQRAQEGTLEYLTRSLQLMQAQPDEYTHDLGTLVAEAFEQGRMKWTHLHQTQDPQTGALRDIVQLQFQLRELG
jgi:hypothetical protein